VCDLRHKARQRQALAMNVESKVAECRGQEVEEDGGSTPVPGSPVPVDLPTTCATCKVAFTAEHHFRVFGGKGYHPDCFLCTACKVKPVTSVAFLVTEDGPICESCSPRCAICRDPVLSNHIMILNQHFHRLCAACTTCGQRFSNLESAIKHDRVPRCATCTKSVFSRDSSGKGSSSLSVKDLEALGCDVRHVFSLGVPMRDGADAAAADESTYQYFKDPMPEARRSDAVTSGPSAAGRGASAISLSSDLSVTSHHTYEHPVRRSSSWLSQDYALPDGARDSQSSAIYEYISDGGTSSKRGSTATLTSEHECADISAPTEEGFRARLSSLSVMLEDDDGVGALTSFAAQCFTLEYVLFWLDCEQFRNFDGTFEDLKAYSELIARKYLDEAEAELFVELPQDILTAVLAVIDTGPHTHALFLDAQMVAFREISEILPTFFKSPAGLQYSRLAIEQAQKAFFTAKSKAITPVSAAIIAFEKIYNETEKFYTYKIRVQAEDVTFSIWRRYSELHRLSTALKATYTTAPVAQFPPKRIFSRSQVRSVATKRQAELDAYLQSVIESEILRTSPLVSQFLRQTLQDISREQDEGRGRLESHSSVR